MCAVCRARGLKGNGFDVFQISNGRTEVVGDWMWRVEEELLQYVRVHLACFFPRTSHSPELISFSRLRTSSLLVECFPKERSPASFYAASWSRCLKCDR